MTDFERQVVADLAYLRAQMDNLAGNGQPGRVSVLEGTVKKLEEHKTKHSVYAMLIGSALTLAAQAAVAYVSVHAGR